MQKAKKLFFMTVSSVGMIFNFSPSALLIKYKELLISAIKSFFPIILRFDLKGIL